MGRFRHKFLSRPVGIWIALLVLAMFVVATIFFHRQIFPHAMEFLRYALFAQVFASADAPLFFVGLVFAVKGMIGIFRRKLWGVFDSYVAFALMATIVLHWVSRSILVLWTLPVLVLATLGLFANRRWFDEVL